MSLAPTRWTYTVTEADQGERLDRLMARLLEDSSRSQIQQHIQAGSVWLDDAAPKNGPRTAVEPGQAIVYEPPPPPPSDLLPEAIPLDILFEDDHLIAINKAAGMVVHPAPGHPTGTLVNALLHYLGDDLERDPADTRPGIVHRLDQGTTGVIVVAKHRKAHEALGALFRAHQLDKRYLAVTKGVPDPREGTADTPYGRHPRDRKKFSSRVLKGKQAITHYQVLEAYPGAALVEVLLETGRTHQVRVHFSDGGYALAGDMTYGARKSVRDPEAKRILYAFQRPALHAWKLSFKHPFSGRKMRLEAPIPDDFQTLVNQLRELSERRMTSPMSGA